MSKERAQRREAREQEAAAREARRAVVVEREARRRARRTSVRRLLGPLRPGRPNGRPTGVLEARRRTRMNLIFASLLLIQVVVWIARPDWQARLAALVVAILAFPVIAAFAL